MKDWMYDEFRQVGVDYSKEEKAGEYDAEMESFRDYDNEVLEFIEKLKISNPKDLIVIDIGCGTGAFSIHAAKYFKKVYAVDVSKEMLKIASEKSTAADIANIEFVNSGILQFQPPEKADIVYTKWVLHHLPDFWKQAGLLNMNNMLKPGGILYLFDFIFKFDPHYESSIDKLIEDSSNEFGEEFANEIKVHIKDEYSTFDWVIQGIIERAGFRIEASNSDSVLMSEYLCRKVSSPQEK